MKDQIDREHLKALLRSARELRTIKEERAFDHGTNPCVCHWLVRCAPNAFRSCDYCQITAALDDLDQEGIA